MTVDKTLLNVINNEKYCHIGLSTGKWCLQYILTATLVLVSTILYCQSIPTGMDNSSRVLLTFPAVTACETSLSDLCLFSWELDILLMQTTAEDNLGHCALARKVPVDIGRIVISKTMDRRSGTQRRLRISL